MSYSHIGSYGLIGNMRTAALVSMRGSIDWLCFPHFDSPSIFAALLDSKKGGHFRIAPDGVRYVTKQLYLPGTPILITRFLSADGVGEVRQVSRATKTSPVLDRLDKLEENEEFEQKGRPADGRS